MNLRIRTNILCTTAKRWWTTAPIRVAAPARNVLYPHTLPTGDGIVNCCCSVLQCVAECCSVLQCILNVLECVENVAVCRSALQCVTVCCHDSTYSKSTQTSVAVPTYTKKDTHTKKTGWENSGSCRSLVHHRHRHTHNHTHTSTYTHTHLDLHTHTHTHTSTCTPNISSRYRVIYCHTRCTHITPPPFQSSDRDSSSTQRSPPPLKQNSWVHHV